MQNITECKWYYRFPQKVISKPRLLFSVSQSHITGEIQLLSRIKKQ